MIELVFIACLRSDPRACEEQILSYVEEGAKDAQSACFLRAQPELAVWAGQHPAFVIASWKCEESERRKIDI